MSGGSAICSPRVGEMALGMVGADEFFVWLYLSGDCLDEGNLFGKESEECSDGNAVFPHVGGF
jgi:hypothetical protein